MIRGYVFVGKWYQRLKEIVDDLSESGRVNLLVFVPTLADASTKACDLREL